MNTFVIVYVGGTLPEEPLALDEVVQNWLAWYESLGASLVTYKPFSSSLQINGEGSAAPGGASGLVGYTVVTAEGIEDVAAMTRQCPHLSSGGTIEIYETFDVVQ